MVETVTPVEAVTLVVQAVSVRLRVRRMDHTPAAWHAEASTSPFHALTADMPSLEESDTKRVD